MRIFSVAVATLVALLPGDGVNGQDAVSYKKDYPNCGASMYYSPLGSNPSSWTRQELEDLVTNTHGDPLPVEGVFEALIELDQSPEGPGSVQLIRTRRWFRSARYVDSRTFVAGQSRGGWWLCFHRYSQQSTRKYPSDHD